MNPDRVANLYLIAVVLLGGFFLLDLLTSAGLIVLLLYFIPVLVASRTPRFLAPLALALAATALIWAGHFLKLRLAFPEPGTAADNRILVTGALWMTAIVLSQRSRTETALRQSNEALRTEIRQSLETEKEVQAEHAFREAMANSLLTGLVAVDREETIISVNDAFCAMTGWSRKELLGMAPPYPFSPPEKAGHDGDLFADIMATGHGPGVAETRLLRRGGERFDVLMRASPLRDPRGILQGYTASVTDISDLKKAEAALAESEERFRSLVRHSLVGFFIVQDGRVVFMNPEQENIFGPVPEGFALGRLAENVHPDDLSRFAALLMAMHGGEERTHETDFRFTPYVPEDADRDRAGVTEGVRAPRWVHARMTPVTWLGKEAVLINMIDVTQVKELERLALSQEKMATLGRVSAGIAHEIRSPLSGINISLSSLEKALEESKGLDPAVRETAGRILETAASASRKIEEVIRRVMDFASPAPPRKEAVSINHCIEEALSLSQAALRRADIRLIKALQEDLPRVPADIRLLENVLVNLLMNAMQAMEGREGDKMIGVTSGLEDGFVVVSVADSGPGVPEENREKIFDPYYTTRSGGTGIGLSWSRKIVSDHGGFIRVDTSRFGGALFTVGVPTGEERRQPSAA